MFQNGEKKRLYGAQFSSSQLNWPIRWIVLTSLNDDITSHFKIGPLLALFSSCARSNGFSKAVSNYGDHSFLVVSDAVTAWWRVQSGSEWCPDGLETLTVRQTSPGDPQLTTHGELWAHPGDVQMLSAALQHRGPGWYLLHVHTAEACRHWPRGAREPGEKELVRNPCGEEAICCRVTQQWVYLTNRLFYSFAKVHLFEFLSSSEVSELPELSVPSTPSSKNRSRSSQVVPVLLP